MEDGIVSRVFFFFGCGGELSKNAKYVAVIVAAVAHRKVLGDGHLTYTQSNREASGRMKLSQCIITYRVLMFWAQQVRLIEGAYVQLEDAYCLRSVEEAMRIAEPIEVCACVILPSRVRFFHLSPSRILCRVVCGVPVSRQCWSTRGPSPSLWQKKNRHGCCIFSALHLHWEHDRGKKCTSI